MKDEEEQSGEQVTAGEGREELVRIMNEER